MKAFVQSGLITNNDLDDFYSLHFQRAARTDKGVSAVKQIISLKLLNDMNLYLSEVNKILPPHIRLFSAKKVTKYFCSKNFCDGRTYSYLLPSFSLCPINQVTTENYKADIDIIKEFNSILKMFIGTHNFHNFTSGKKFVDPSSQRYIMSFECSQPFTLSNNEKKIEFLLVEVKGQSFMLHQIRKMIGLAIGIIRGLVDKSIIIRSFEAEKLDIPIAPGLGLLLEEVHYDRYNKKYGGDGIHESLVWDEVNDQIISLKNTHIYPRIVETEIHEKSMFKWLEILPIHSFDVRSNESFYNNKILCKNEIELEVKEENEKIQEKESIKTNLDNHEDFIESEPKKIKLQEIIE